MTNISRALPLKRPENVSRVKWGSVTFIAVFHLLALLAFVPGFFSWSGFWVMIAGFVLGYVAIAMGYHRLFTHRSFKFHKWFVWCEYILVFIAYCTLQGSVIDWVADHRHHHQHVDTQPDPHTPLVDFLWAHMFWLFFYNPATEGENVFKNTKDLERDSVHLFFHKGNKWLLIWTAHVVIICAIGFWIGGMTTMMSFLVWGVFVRTVVFWHGTWSINSWTHVKFLGYQNFSDEDESRNSPAAAILGFGEAWHNNHHNKPNVCSTQVRFWELDPVFYLVFLLWCVRIIKSYNKREKIIIH